MNRIWFLLLLLTLFFQRNTPNADELLPVTSAAVRMEQGRYHLLIEGARQSSLEGNAEAVYLEASADTADALFQEAQAIFAEHLTFMHTSLLLIDPSIPTSDIAPLCASLLNEQNAPRTAYLAYAENADADELLRHEHPVEEIPGLGLRDLLRATELQREIPPIATLADGAALMHDHPLSLSTLRITEKNHIICGEDLLISSNRGAL